VIWKYLVYFKSFAFALSFESFNFDKQVRRKLQTVISCFSHISNFERSAFIYLYIRKM
jgi:hypothetical protein